MRFGITAMRGGANQERRSRAPAVSPRNLPHKAIIVISALIIFLDSQVNELKDESTQLKKQIASLQRELVLHNNETPEGGGTPDPRNSLPTSFSSSVLFSLPVLPLPLLATNDHLILSRKSRPQALPGFVFASFGLLDDHVVGELDDLDQDDGPSKTTANQLPRHQISQSSSVDALPSMEEAHSIIRSLLESTKHGPSNLDKILDQTQLDEDIRLVYGLDGFLAPRYANNRFRCFITVYVAMCMAAAVRGVDVTADARAIACRNIGLKELSSITSREDLVSQLLPNFVFRPFL
jgi:hypothetical protein